MPETEAGNSGESQQNTAVKQETFIIRILRAVERKPNKKIPQHKPEETPHQRNERLVAESSWLIGRLTIVIAVSAIVSVVASILQYCTMKGQLNEMEVSDRPWIKATVRLDHPLVFDINGLNSLYTITLTNVGHSPAVNVETGFIAYLSYGTHQDPTSEEFKICDSQYPVLRWNPEMGDVIFPGDQIKALGIIQFSPAQVKAATFMQHKQPQISLQVIGCIDYLFDGSTQIHKTGFVYQVWYLQSPADGGGASPFIWPGVTLPVQSIGTEIYPDHGSQAN